MPRKTDPRNMEMSQSMGKDVRNTGKISGLAEESTAADRATNRTVDYKSSPPAKGKLGGH